MVFSTAACFPSPLWRSRDPSSELISRWACLTPCTLFYFHPTPKAGGEFWEGVLASLVLVPVWFSVTVWPRLSERASLGSTSLIRKMRCWNYMRRLNQLNHSGVAERRDSGPSIPKFKFQCCHLPGVWFWGKFLNLSVTYRQKDLEQCWDIVSTLNTSYYYYYYYY